MVRKIISNVKNVAGVMTPLIFFDCLFDIDFGLIATIVNTYLDPEVFDSEIRKKPVREIIKTLYNRTERNPLIPFMQSAKISEADKYLDMLMTDEESYTEVIQKSIHTGLYNLLESFAAEPDIKPTVVIPDGLSMEKWNKTWKNSVGKVSTIMIDELSDKTIEQYQQIYCKDPETILELMKRGIAIDNKTIYVAAYQFNLNSESLEISNPAMRIIADGNRIDIIDIYNRNLLEGKGNDN